jgi:probable F420-dependent oxidoreductase
MDFGLSLFASDRGIRPREAAAAAERAGFDAFYVGQHTHIPVAREAAHPQTGDETLPDDRYLRMPDPWVGLAMAAAVTSRIRLGTSVALPLQHDPITLGKAIASLDHFSEGRVVLGVGIGWNFDEMADHNVPLKRRRAALREWLGLMRAMWTQEVASFEGEFASLSPSWCWPKPVQAGGPPVLFGAGSSERNFRWIAQNADGWITTPIQTEIEQAVLLLHKIWQEAGRDGEPRTVVLDRGGVDHDLARYRDLGISEVQLTVPDVSAEEAQERILGYADKITQHR